MKELIEKENLINLHYDLQIYSIVKKFCSIYPVEIDENYMTIIILRKMTNTYSKVYLDSKKTFTSNFNVFKEEIIHSEEYKELLASINSINQLRYREIIEIHLDRQHTLHLEPLIGVKGSHLIDHIILKFFPAYTTHEQENFKTILTTLLTFHEPGKLSYEMLPSELRDSSEFLLIQNINLDHLVEYFHQLLLNDAKTNEDEHLSMVLPPFPLQLVLPDNSSNDHISSTLVNSFNSSPPSILQVDNFGSSTVSSISMYSLLEMGNNPNLELGRQHVHISLEYCGECSSHSAL